MSYNAAQLIGKTFKADGPVPIYDSATNTAKPVRYVQSGQIVGVLYSWLDPSGSYRTDYWWMFYDANGHAFYVPFAANSNIDESFFREQGSLTTLEQIQAEQDANKEWYEKLFDNVKPLIVTAIVGGLAVKYLVSKKLA